MLQETTVESGVATTPEELGLKPLETSLSRKSEGGRSREGSPTGKGAASGSTTPSRFKVMHGRTSEPAFPRDGAVEAAESGGGEAEAAAERGWPSSGGGGDPTSARAELVAALLDSLRAFAASEP